ncbi:dihydroorotate dehydrogenase electron transfer subunit [Kitasatospora gansuensis]|uniref:Dihydroorotate dehydrogenase electron transfer subunit n=1 Tax=Kitasatospora gansuensis TaxID=258050 RepID=A0A7W7S7U2_9ACTN|nr:dihydroorotate dehydrogenase electron transfer subunit [Kitasatospora gansuensis]MBB4945287.1 dihydroorotate dehydrogenase electron transfer subunit [Kitasatospora gansuensis]
MAHPVQTEAEVVESAPAGAYRRLVLRAPEAARRVRPGHFATLAVGGGTSSMLLRRAFSIHRADVEAGTIELVVAEHGPGTRELVRSRVGDRLSLIAPLGTPFPLPEGPVSALLVAGGYGSAPLFPLAEEIKRRGGQVGFILGAATEARLFGVEAARALTQDVLVVTEDGSAGLTGLVTEPLAQAIKAIDATVVHACGPMPMLRAVTGIAEELGTRCWTAVEESMACGVGICMTCVLPVVGEDGVSRFVRSCTDGPVFDGAKVRWADLGTVPADLEGAAAMGVRG